MPFVIEGPRTVDQGNLPIHSTYEKMGIMRRFGELNRWYPRDMPSDERKLVFKLDLLILSYACLAFFTKYLDVSALSNAYVSGMQDDLNLTGNDLNYITALYETGYIVFQIPSNLLVTKIPAQYYLPCFEIAWGLFTLGTAFVTSYKQLLVLRFFVGLSATSCYIGCLHVVNSWYKKSELGRRNALFWIANPLGTMFAGYLQAAAYTNLNGQHGMQGWRWLFVICAIITIPIAFVGFFFFPDIPERTKSRWLSESEKELARRRIAEDGFKPSLGINRTLLARVFKKWETYLFFLIGGWYGILVYGSSTPFLLWLKSQPDKYSTPKVNTLSTVTSAVSIVSSLIIAFYADLTGRRWDTALLAGLLILFANAVLAGWNVPEGFKFFCYLVLGACHGVGPSIVTWTAESLAGDMELRSLLLAVQNVAGEINFLLVPLLAFPVSHSPAFRGGYIWNTSTSALWLIIVGIIAYVQYRKRRQTLSNQPEENNFQNEQGQADTDAVKRSGSLENKDAKVSIMAHSDPIQH